MTAPEPATLPAAILNAKFPPMFESVPAKEDRFLLPVESLQTIELLAVLKLKDGVARIKTGNCLYPRKSVLVGIKPFAHA